VNVLNAHEHCKACQVKALARGMTLIPAGHLTTLS